MENVEKEFTDEFRTHHQITTQHILTWVSSYGKTLKTQVKKALAVSAISAEVNAEPQKNGKRSADQIVDGEDQAVTHVPKKPQTDAEYCSDTPTVSAVPSPVNGGKRGKGSRGGKGSKGGNDGNGSINARMCLI